MRWPFTAAGGPKLHLPEKSASPSTRFACKLFRQLAGPGPGNIFYSPASVMLCLRMLQDGATGETHEALSTVLEVAGLDTEAVQLAIANLKSALQIPGASLQLEAASSIWCNRQWTPRPEYVAKVRTDYDAEVAALDFGKPETISRINGWVAEKTRGKIGGILGALDPLSALVAVNAIYFKDRWAQPFPREITRQEPFHCSDGRKIEVPLMTQRDTYPYYEESKFQAVRLGYRTPRLAMYVFLPSRRSSLERFQRNLNSSAWDGWMKRMKTMEGQVRLPRFKLTYQASLNGALSALGMEIAFDRQRARFDAISPPPPEIWIGEILHRAFVEVNEEGTEAAAATGGMVCLSARFERPKRTFKMIVDRPFFFAIRDDLTGTILFMGGVEDPLSEGGERP